jgi:hypothetical protein
MNKFKIGDKFYSTEWQDVLRLIGRGNTNADNYSCNYYIDRKDRIIYFLQWQRYDEDRLKLYNESCLKQDGEISENSLLNKDTEFMGLFIKFETEQELLAIKLKYLDYNHG